MADNVAALPCPTCSFPSRETVDMVCRTCLTDYAPGPSRWAEGYAAGRDLVCIRCFVVLADEAGVTGSWRVYVDPEPEGVKRVTPSGRWWDYGRWAWRAEEVGDDHA